MELRARQEIAEVSEWWVRNRPAAPSLFWEELDKAYDRISEYPHVGKVADDVDLAGVRRVTLRRTRYYLYYRLSDDERAIEVLALWHTSRGTSPDL